MASASNRLNDKRSKSHVLVLLTDGENNAGKIPPNTAAEAVKALKIHFYAIGAGINGIAPAPVFTSRGPLTDALGNILYENQPVEFNENGLKEVAKIADGKFFRATDTQSLEQIFNDIDKLEKSTISVKNISNTAIFPAVSDGRVRTFGGATSFVSNDLEKVTVRMSKHLTVEALKRPSCHVERSETSRFSSSAAGIRYQRFFSCDSGIRMTPELNASMVQPFSPYTNP